ncbi:MAG: HAMP domain-containing histidine kinase, partial [Desulfobacteraceae bacterium]
MRFPFYSLKTGILTHLTLLIISAMLLINLVMVKFSERDLIQAKIKTGRLLLHMLEKRVGYAIAGTPENWEKLGSAPKFKSEISQLLLYGGFSELLIVSREGIKVFGAGSWGEAEKKALSISREAVATKKEAFDFYGSTWGVIWLAHERINVAAPMFFQGRLIGAATICGHLEPIYQALRKSEKIILIYIFLNTIILVLFGIYLLSRTVVKPIHALLRITEGFKDDEPFPQLAEAPQNEFGQLFRSLNMMLKRLDKNKTELRMHISSLEKANKEIRKAQNEIIRAEKLASVGRLATGVAHEIGNPIGIVLGYLELLKKGRLSREEKHDFLNRMESEITRINDIIRQLLHFSRLTSGEQKETSVHNLILELVDMLKPQPMMVGIQVQPVLKAGTDTVWTDPNQLKQVFLNVIMNAADAMSTDEASRDASTKALTIKSIDMEDSIELRFTDTGLGISEQELGRIFDPFYTTKEPGKGTGLGLSVCYRIMEGLGGTIRAESTKGKGTTIIIDIPLYHHINNS